MFKSYFEIFYSRKVKRCILFTTVIVIISILIPIIVFFDITCVSHSYEPNLSLKSSLVKSKTPEPYPDWTDIIDDTISLYSAFYYNNNIKIIALLRNYRTGIQLFCHLSNTNSSLKTDAFYEILPESYVNYYKYIAVKIICPNVWFKNNLKVKISIKNNKNLKETSFIPVVNIEENEKVLKTYERNQKVDQEIVVCVRPLYGPFSSFSSILEFIAYYRANGINKFIFYDLSITPKMRSLLESMPFVELLPFHLPINSNDIHAEGQISAINDCLLRSSPNTVILVDIDELIITKSFRDIKTYVDFKLKNELTGALVIPNVMVCDQFETNRNVEQFPRIFYALERQTFKWQHRDRSKLIILKPLSVAQLGIHTIWLWNNNSGVYSENVDESEAMLFHYRSCCMVWQPFYTNSFTGIRLFFLAYNDKTVIDKSVLKFKNEIISFLKKYVNFDEISLENSQRHENTDL